MKVTSFGLRLRSGVPLVCRCSVCAQVASAKQRHIGVAPVSNVFLRTKLPCLCVSQLDWRPLPNLDF
uniref:Uncharacterized protein n=1 Tax=Arundo donax TaxID=35708 RepID=A0A0A9GQU3_ARUDO